MTALIATSKSAGRVTALRRTNLVEIRQQGVPHVAQIRHENLDSVIALLSQIRDEVAA